LSGREWDADRHEYSVDARVRADVFVFAVQTQREPDAYDMLDLGHWEFWVVDGRTVRMHAGRTVGIGWVRRHAVGPVPYGDLAAVIDAARRQNGAAEPERGSDGPTDIHGFYAEQHAFAAARDSDVVPRLFIERALESEIFLVGQALGRDTQRLSGMPYVFPGGPPHALSRGGQVLDRWLADVGYTISPDATERRYAYHADLHPGFPGRKRGGGDVVPSSADVEASAAWLRAEIELVSPRILIALGKEPALELLRRYGGVEPRRLGEVTDRIWPLRVGKLDLPLVAVYHPSGAFQHPVQAESAWAFVATAIAHPSGA
jgi:uracil-DNA glycosylase family 4